jgi:hypothetical protein
VSAAPLLRDLQKFALLGGVGSPSCARGRRSCAAAAPPAGAGADELDEAQEGQRCGGAERRRGREMFPARLRRTARTPIPTSSNTLCKRWPAI